MFLVSTRIIFIVSVGLVKSYEENKKITAPKLASDYNLNVRVLNSALRSLVKAGILNSQIGGTQPGFIFSRNPRQISLYEIITALEGKTRMMSCHDVIPNMKCDIKDCSRCMLYEVVSENLKNLHDKLKSISIFDHYKKFIDRHHL